MKKVAIIGAGISGLSIAHYLKKSNAEIEITLLERSDRIGGNIRSETHAEFLMEFGPSAFKANDYDVLDMVNDIEFKSDLIYSKTQSNRHFTTKRGELIPLPQEALEYFKCDLVRTPFSTFFKERKLKALDVYDSVKSFSFRHFDKTIANHIIESYLTRIYKGDSSKLSTNSCLAELKEIERKSGSLLKAKSKNEKAFDIFRRDKKGFFSFRNGMESFLHKIADFHHLNILFGQQVKSITDSPDGKVKVSVNDSDYKFDQVFLTTPSFVSAHLLRNCDEEFYKSLGLIKYAPLALVNLVFNYDCIKKVGNGYTVSSPEKEDVLSVYWMSQQFPEHGKSGHHTLSVLMGGALHPDLLKLQAHQIVKSALKHLRRFMHIKSDPVHVKIRQYSRAIPQYTMGIEKVWARLDEVKARHPNIILCGNYQYGVEAGDCVRQAKKIVEDFR